MPFKLQKGAAPIARLQIAGKNSGRINGEWIKSAASLRLIKQ
jgi:hypothetical protein